VKTGGGLAILGSGRDFFVGPTAWTWMCAKIFDFVFSGFLGLPMDNNART